MPKIIMLTDEQIRIILGLIDDHTPETEPDYFYDEEKKLVFKWDGEGKEFFDLQAHLDKFLDRKKLDY